MKWAFFAITLSALIWSLWNAILDYSFYYKNGGDFTKESGTKINHGDGDGPLMSPKTRLLYGHPFLILNLTLFTLLIWFH